MLKVAEEYRINRVTSLKPEQLSEILSEMCDLNIITVMDGNYRFVTDGFRKLLGSQKTVEKRMSDYFEEAQIKLVFPKLENSRAELIRKYETKIQRFLPIRSSNNDKIGRATDLEIGQLFFVRKENRASKITEYTELEMLRKMRDARNTLAHWETLSYKQLKDLSMI